MPKIEPTDLTAISPFGKTTTIFVSYAKCPFCGCRSTDTTLDVDMNPPFRNLIAAFDKKIPSLPCCSPCKARYVRWYNWSLDLPLILGFPSSMLHRLTYQAKVRDWVRRNSTVADPILENSAKPKDTPALLPEVLLFVVTIWLMIYGVYYTPNGGIERCIDELQAVILGQQHEERYYYFPALSYFLAVALACLPSFIYAKVAGRIFNPIIRFLVFTILFGIVCLIGYSRYGLAPLKMITDILSAIP